MILYLSLYFSHFGDIFCIYIYSYKSHSQMLKVFPICRNLHEYIKLLKHGICNVKVSYLLTLLATDFRSLTNLKAWFQLLDIRYFKNASVRVLISVSLFNGFVSSIVVENLAFMFHNFSVRSVLNLFKKVA